MVFKATFNNISVLLVEETGVPTGACYDFFFFRVL